ncbi:MAG: aminotransferase class V-fold PLP-dependent enzyme, partial [Persicimonas sp.]
AERHDEEGERRVRRAAGRYLDMSHENIALTESTTTGLVTVYNGIRIREDQEVLTGHWNHWATEGTLEYRSQKAGFDIRNARLFDTLDDSVTPEQLTDRLIDEIAPNTRIVAVTWVHSDTGLKLPIADIGERIQAINRDRSDDDRILFCIDGAHGLGVEDAVMEDFNCDFFVAGCHKWLFGPRGTGIIAATPQAWAQAIPTVPSFSGDTTQGRRFTPGGFHAFEHRWALEQAFDFHLDIGKDRVEQRIHALAEHLIDGLSQLDHVDLRTPTNPELHAGIVSFAVDDMGPFEVTSQLDLDGIVASTTPGDLILARLSPGLLNTHEHVEDVLGAISRMR